MSIINQLKILSQYLLPKHAVSILAGKLADSQKPMIKDNFIKRFAKAYNIDMSIAVEPNLDNYACFNDFFTRAIDLKHRPIDPSENALCSPVDGAISQFGDIRGGKIIQAKGHDYSALELLAGDKALADQFANGQFCTIYLAPKDYHRIHMPCAGELVSMTHVPGQLFSVNPLTAENVPKLFARNERVVSVFNTPFGKMASVAVGATIVGSIETTWAGTITPPTRKNIQTTQYENDAISFQKGQEMGRFKLGSTVILLLENKPWQWHDAIKNGADVVLGQKIVTDKSPK